MNCFNLHKFWKIWTLLIIPGKWLCFNGSLCVIHQVFLMLIAKPVSLRAEAKVFCALCVDFCQRKHTQWFFNSVFIETFSGLFLAVGWLGK